MVIHLLLPFSPIAFESVQTVGRKRIQRTKLLLDLKKNKRLSSQKLL